MSKPIRLNPECIRCLVKGRMDSPPEGVTKEKQIEYMQKLLGLIANAPKDMSAPVVVRDVEALEKEMFGLEKDYTDIKIHFNNLMLSKEERMMRELKDSEDSLKLAVQFAMMGNYIDFGAFQSIDEDKLEGFLQGAKNIELRQNEYDNLKEDLEKAKRILYLTDNCGEIVTDKILVRIMKKMNPDAELTVMVRGAKVLNDATMEDAVQVGMTEIARVVGNGSNIAGTWIPDLSLEARQLMSEADVIIAKGQGNYECLQMWGYNVYYIFMCKCDMFAERFGVEKFTGMLVNEKNI